MNAETPTRKILLLGASGLIGRFVTDDLRAKGFHVVGIARHFAPSQKATAFDLEMPVMAMDAADLARLIQAHGIDIVVNCLGVLQDGPGSDTRAVHRDFVARLLQAIGDSGRAIRLIHISIPGTADADRTAFSTTKREAERLISASGVAHAILRPGFVVAPSAYGGSAMVRALAALPADLPAEESATPFQPVAVEDIADTIAWLAERDIDDAAANNVTWDLMQPQPVTLGRVIEQFRWSFGTSDWPRLAPPAFLIDLGARLGDLAALARLDAADALECDCRIAARRGRRSRRLDRRHRHRAQNHRAGGWAASCDHPGQMVRAAVFGQGAGDREPGAVLDRFGLHRACSFPIRPPPAS